MEDLNPNWEAFATVGYWSRDAILWIAGLLKAEYVPGLVSLFLIGALIGVIIWFRRWRRQRSRALQEVLRQLSAIKGEEAFRELAPKLDAHFQRLSTSRNRAMRSVATAWKEYRETNVFGSGDESNSVRNALRPSLFFNLEDLGFTFGWWRAVPGLFVSFGLALTFLGLISALHETARVLDPMHIQVIDAAANADSTLPQTRALNDLLKVASAKFIMSLTGLFCSIVFTFFLRHGMHRLEHDVHTVCHELETRLSYVSLEEIAMAQLKAVQAQKEHMTALTTQLIAEIGAPLQNELPAAISRSITQAIQPVMENIGRVGSEGMGQMVQDLSSRFSRDVGQALNAASGQLAEAGARLGQIAARMDESSARMGSEFDVAVARLTRAVEELRDGMAQTAEGTASAFTQGAETMLASMNQALDRIGRNTEETVIALQKVARSLAESAVAFRQEIEAASAAARQEAQERMAAASGEAADRISEAGARLLQSFDTAIEATARRAEQLSGKAGEELLKPLEELRAAFEALVDRVGTGSERMARFADGVTRGATAAEAAAGSLETAATGLAAAAAPVRDTVLRLETAAGRTAEATASAAEAVRHSAQQVAEAAAAALASAQEVLGSERRAIQASLESVEAALERFQDIVERYDEIDAKLGDAFRTFQEQVGKSLAEVREHAGNVHEKFAGALDQLREVVDQAQTFMPESRTA